MTLSFLSSVFIQWTVVKMTASKHQSTFLCSSWYFFMILITALQQFLDVKVVKMLLSGDDPDHLYTISIISKFALQITWMLNEKYIFRFWNIHIIYICMQSIQPTSFRSFAITWNARFSASVPLSWRESFSERFGKPNNRKRHLFNCTIC